MGSKKEKKKEVCELISYVGEVVDPRSSTSMNQDAGQHFDWRLNVSLFYFSSFSGFKIPSVRVPCVKREQGGVRKRLNGWLVGRRLET